MTSISVEYDLRYLAAGIEQLESYLLSNDVYRPIGISSARGAPPYPQLTLGWMLLSRLRAQAASKSLSQETQLASLSGRLEMIRSNWRTAWGKKAEIEFRLRLNLWRDFLDELREDPSGNADRFSYEISRRVLLQLLLAEAEPLPEADLQALRGLDAILKSHFLPGEFIWDPAWTSSFPKSSYWYLYGAISLSETPD
jgi:hypothetical protein